MKIFLKLTFLFFLFFTIIVNSEENKKSAPDIIAKDIYNQEFKLLKFKGKPIILQFMRVYCGGRVKEESIKQFKQLSDLYNKYYDEKNLKKSKIIFVTITLSSCTSSDIKKLAEENGIKWTFINDYSDGNLEIIQAYSEYIKNIPEPALIFINKKFEIINTSSLCDDNKLEEYIKKLLKKK